MKLYIDTKVLSLKNKIENMENEILAIKDHLKLSELEFLNMNTISHRKMKETLHLQIYLVQS